MSKHYVNRDNAGAKRRILRVTIHREVDDCPDLSYLGEYSARPKGEHSIDRQEQGDMSRGEYRCFTPAMTGEQTGNPESPEQDYRRMEAYQRGDWCMVGLYAEAEVQLGSTVCQRIRSGGLWGIESDSGESYFAEIRDEQLSELRDELSAIGFSKRQIDRAFENVGEEE